MKLNRFVVLLPIVLVCFLSCSGNRKKQRPPVSQIITEGNRKRIVSGDTIVVHVNTKLKGGELKSSKFFLGDKQLILTEEPAYTVTINTSGLPLGEHSIRVVAVNTTGQTSTNYKAVTLLSDVIPETYTYKVMATFPHNTGFFTQGLEIDNGFMYEGTGEHTHSGIYKTDIKSGNVLQSYKLPDNYFGEGITIFDGKIYQLTYLSQKGFVYNLETFAKTDSFTYTNKEGWGLTHTDKHLVMSDGSSTLTYFDPATLKPVKTVKVCDNKGEIDYINELEYVDGIIWANIWQSNFILKIDAETGKVLGKANLYGLLPAMDRPGERRDVLNGIAYDHDTGKMYVTGKLWPKLYEIELKQE